MGYILGVTEIAEDDYTWYVELRVKRPENERGKMIRSLIFG
jgi:hypothetical protein